MSLKTAGKHIGRTWSLAGRLTALYAGSAFALVLVCTILIHWNLVSSLEEEDDQFLVERAHVLSKLIAGGKLKSRELRWEVESEWQGISTPQSFARIVDETGRTLTETPGMKDRLPSGLFPATPKASGDVKFGRDVRSPTGQLFRVVSTEVERPHGGGKQILQIAVDRSGDEAVVRKSIRILALVLTAALLASLFAGYQIAYRGMLPVTSMAAKAATIESGTLGERLSVEGLPAELRALAGTFNEMLGRLEGSFERLSRFSANIAHELRTPLNNLQGEAEVALSRSRSADDYREIVSSSLEEYERLSRIIDSLLFLARAESPEMLLKRETLDLGQELQTIKEFYEAAAEEKGVDIHTEVPLPVAADIDRMLFQRALGNLVSNAVAHTPPEGCIALRAYREGHGVRVEVADNGVGIPAEHLPHIFDRFYRPDGARSRNSGGFGLGLAIVRSIASVHGGEAEIQSEAGRGTTVRLTLPNVTKS